MHSILLLLVVIGLCLGQLAVTEFTSSSNNRQQSSFNNKNNPADQQKLPIPIFQKGYEYSFKYNMQIATGFIAQDDQNQADAQQKSITRIQSQAKITFVSEHRGQLCLRKIRAGQLNEFIHDEYQLQPMSIFEPRLIPSDEKRLLDQCCQFDYADGVIGRIQFNLDDQAWSKNMKRGVLQMIQLNLNQNNAQGLRPENAHENQNKPINFVIPDDDEQHSSADDFAFGGIEENDNNFTLPPPKPIEMSFSDLPPTFDSRIAWPECPSIGRILDQGNCHNCWAVQTAAVFSDRFCIKKGIQLTISAIDLTTCCYDCVKKEGCQGGGSAKAFKFFETMGVVSEQCRPYPFEHCYHVKSLPNPYPACNPIPPTPELRRAMCRQIKTLP